MKATAIDFTKGHLLKKFIIFVLPLIATGVLQALFNAADLIVVGQFAGETALAAVGGSGIEYRRCGAADHKICCYGQGTGRYQTGT